MRGVRGENFPVASRILPREARRHLLAIYGFARLVDLIGDEAPGDRLLALDWIEDDLERAFHGIPQHPLMRRLATTVREARLPQEPFRRLIAANRQDQRVREYATFDDLLAYCELSANPVGHLVLHVFSAATPERLALSDLVCTSLQLTEHWQDVREDYLRGRRYIPAQDLLRFSCRPEELSGPAASPEIRRLMAFETARTMDMLRSGAPLTRSLPTRAGLAVAAFVAGGLSALESIERAGFDVLSRSPRPSPAGTARAFLRVLLGPDGSWRPGGRLT